MSAPHDVTVELRVNGDPRRATMDARTTLADAIRDHFDLPGTHVGCGEGACGACTVLLDGEDVRGCLVLAAQADGREVTTVEGLEGAAGELHLLQRAFAEHDAAAVRLLHARHAAHRAGAAARGPGPVGGAGPRAPRRQPLPLHGLPRHRRRGPCGRFDRT